MLITNYDKSFLLSKKLNKIKIIRQLLLPEEAQTQHSIISNHSFHIMLIHNPLSSFMPEIKALHPQNISPFEDEFKNQVKSLHLKLAGIYPELVNQRLRLALLMLKAALHGLICHDLAVADKNQNL